MQPTDSTLEITYPTGHRQICKPFRIGDTGQLLYECLTVSPDGDNVEYKYLSPTQLDRITRRLRRAGGTVREIED